VEDFDGQQHLTSHSQWKHITSCISVSSSSWWRQGVGCCKLWRWWQ